MTNGKRRIGRPDVDFPVGIVSSPCKTHTHSTLKDTPHGKVRVETKHRSHPGFHGGCRSEAKRQS